MINVAYKPGFVRAWRKLSPLLRNEAKEKIELFKNVSNHEQLKVHKLLGLLKGCYAFSVNYKIRIIFEYKNKVTVALLDIGAHEIYE